MLTNELSGAIRTIEGILHDLRMGNEICVSDIEANLVEWRGALYGATQGKDPLFTEYDMYTVTIDNKIYRFRWPDDAYDHIKTFYCTGGALFATSIGVNELPFHPDGLRPSDHLGCTTVLLGMCGNYSDPVYWIEASKTNLKRV